MLNLLSINAFTPKQVLRDHVQNRRLDVIRKLMVIHYSESGKLQGDGSSSVLF